MPKAPPAQFWFAAALRIMDAPDLHDELTSLLGPPTYSHRKGELNDSPQATRPWQNSIWSVESPLPEQRDLGEHLGWIADFALPHADYLRDLIARRAARVDIYMSYHCSEDHRGIGLDPERLEVFVRLGVRFELSIMT